jgi:hypothetical protein
MAALEARCFVIAIGRGLEGARPIGEATLCGKKLALKKS